MTSGRRHLDHTTRVLFIVALILVIIAIYQAVYIFTRAEPEDVLKFPSQNVANRHEEGEVPVVNIPSSVVVKSVKCNTSESDIEVTGKTYWTGVAPIIPAIEVAEGTAIREPGCVSLTYVNPVPQEVKDITCQILERDKVETVAWRINGSETPIDTNRYQVATWTTETFYLADPYNTCK